MLRGNAVYMRTKATIQYRMCGATSQTRCSGGPYNMRTEATIRYQHVQRREPKVTPPTLDDQRGGAILSITEKNLWGDVKLPVPFLGPEEASVTCKKHVWRRLLPLLLCSAALSLVSFSRAALLPNPHRVGIYIFRQFQLQACFSQVSANLAGEQRHASRAMLGSLWASYLCRLLW